MTPRLTRFSMNSMVTTALMCMAFLMQAETSVAEMDKAILLNNDGVKALNVGNYSLAKQRFEEALKVFPNYDLARENLALVCGRHGNPDDKRMMWELRQTFFFNDPARTNCGRLEMMIKLSGKDPKSFDDRMALAEECKSKADYIGAYVEYLEALKLRRSDARARDLLIELIHLLDKPGLESCFEIAKRKAAPFLDKPVEPAPSGLTPIKFGQ